MSNGGGEKKNGQLRCCETCVFLHLTIDSIQLNTNCYVKMRIISHPSKPTCQLKDVMLQKKTQTNKKLSSKYEMCPETNLSRSHKCSTFARPLSFLCLVVFLWNVPENACYISVKTTVRTRRQYARNSICYTLVVNYTAFIH